MAEVKAAEKGRQSEHLEKEVSSRGNCTSSSKTVDKDSCKDNSDSTAAKTYMRFYAGAVTQDSGLEGIRFDFNYGARVEVPAGDYRVRFLDREACLTLYDSNASGVLVTSSKKYFVDFRIEVYERDKLIFAHDLDLQGKKVLIKFPVGILGDILAWFPYAEVFRKKHECDLYCAMAEEMIEIIKPGYPEIKQQKLWQQGRSKEYYTLITDTLRKYIEERFGINAMEMTSGEILELIRKNSEAQSVYDNLRQILQLADFVKFFEVHPLFGWHALILII